MEKSITHSKQAGALIVKSFKNVIKLHIQLGHDLEKIAWAMGKAMGLELTNTCKIAEILLLEKQKGLIEN